MEIQTKPIPKSVMEIRRELEAAHDAGLTWDQAKGVIPKNHPLTLAFHAEWLDWSANP